MSLYDHTDQLNSDITYLKQANFSDHNTQVLMNAVNRWIAEDLSTHRIRRYIQSWRRMEQLVDFMLDEAGEDDIRDLVADINRGRTHDRDLSCWTRAEYRKAVRKLYVTIGRQDDVDWISCRPKKHEQPRTDPSELVTKSEVHALIDGATNMRDKALIFVLWESGARISELLSTEWRDVTLSMDVTQIRLRKSKTGERTVPVKLCTGHLQEIQRRSGPVFRKQNGDRMPYSTVRSILARARRHTDLPDHKKTNPHALRKSRATYLARHGWNHAQLCKYFGWSATSDAPAVYIRLAKQDVEDAIKNMHRDTDAAQTTLA